MSWSETQIWSCNYLSSTTGQRLYWVPSICNWKLKGFYRWWCAEVQFFDWFLLTAVFLFMFLDPVRKLFSWWNDSFQKHSRANVWRSKVIVTLAISHLTNNYVSTRWTPRSASNAVSYFYHLKCTLHSYIWILNASFKRKSLTCTILMT